MTASSDPPVGPLPARTRVVVIGAGFAGIGAAVTLTRAGHDVLVLERADDLGGTWRDNAYPGCACDVQSHLYSFSFAPNPNWTRTFSPQPEILAYLHDVVDRFAVGDRIRCGVEATDARWDDDARVWRITTSAGPTTADVLVGATGPLSRPLIPPLPGLEDFTGDVMHSSAWHPDLDVTGRRVAVIGSGASAIQIVPQLAGRASELIVFQRTAPWILPRGDREIPIERRHVYSEYPWLQTLARAWIYASREVSVIGFVNAPFLLRGVERIALAHLERSVSDPGLRAELTPDYRAGCKRILLSDDYYPAVDREDVELVPSGVARFEPRTVVADDGTRRDVDVVVLATGFEATDMAAAHRITGRAGRLLSDVWQDGGTQALRGATVHGFPNLFLLVGPNTGLGHTSMIHVIESQLAYLADGLATLDRRGLDAIEPTAHAQAAWNTQVQQRLSRSVWATGCSSWYQDPQGRIPTLWPGSTLRLRRATRRLDPLEYRLYPRRTPTPSAPADVTAPGAAPPDVPPSEVVAPDAAPIDAAPSGAAPRTGGKL
jgi:cation diffusion facilitator CzcD-associated flavoprotein CzcO